MGLRFLGYNGCYPPGPVLLTRRIFRFHVSDAVGRSRLLFSPRFNNEARRLCKRKRGEFARPRKLGYPLACGSALKSCAFSAGMRFSVALSIPKPKPKGVIDYGYD